MNRSFFSVNQRHWARAAVLIAACASAVESTAQQTVAPEKVVGRTTCTICHKSEQAAWNASSHGTKAWKLLGHPDAAKFAKALGVTDIKGASACTQCHGTQQIKAGQLIVDQGNSCESCHGGAGGANGWLKTHFNFGLRTSVPRENTIAVLLGDRAKETAAHRAERESACRAAGMNRSADAFQIASNCLQCHLVPNEKLVAAKHPMSTRFEFVDWAQGEVRHNFLFDPKTNAEVPTGWSDRQAAGTVDSRKRLMYVAGQLADLYVSLRTRATVTSVDRKTLGDEVNDRIVDIQEELAEFDIPELAGMLAAISKLDKKAVKKMTDDDKQIYSAAATTVETAAKAFVAAHQDGTKLPASIKIPNRAQGTPHQPKP